MDTIKNNVGKVEKKKSKVLDNINNLKNKKVISSNEGKRNYIHSLCSISNYKDLSLTIKMNEDMAQGYGEITSSENGISYSNEISVNKGGIYKGRIEKINRHQDGKLSIGFVPEGDEAMIKMFIERFEIITDKKTIGNTGIIEGTKADLVKVDPELDGMGGEIIEPVDEKGVVDFINLRGQQFFLEDGMVIKFWDTDENIILKKNIEPRKSSCSTTYEDYMGEVGKDGLSRKERLEEK